MDRNHLKRNCRSITLHANIVNVIRTTSSTETMLERTDERESKYEYEFRLGTPFYVPGRAFTVRLYMGSTLHLRWPI